MIFYTMTCPDDDPMGIKQMENPTKTLKAILFPRSALGFFNAMQESRQAGVYLLYDSDDTEGHLYIGQTGISIQSRLSDHNRNRDAGDNAIVFVERDNGRGMNMTYTKLIEAFLINEAEACGATVMDNATGSNPSEVEDYVRYSAESWAKILLL